MEWNNNLGDKVSVKEEDDEGDYNSQVVYVDPGDIVGLDDDDDDDEGELDDEEMEEYEDEEGELMIDDDLITQENPSKEDHQSTRCDQCDKSFSGRKHLARHIRTVHEKASSVVCKHCSKVLSDVDSYRRHLINVHKLEVQDSSPIIPSASPSIPCPECKQTFATKTTLNLHRLKCHVVNLKPTPCPSCREVFPDLSTHMKTAHGVEGIICPHCANVFSKKCTLNRHIEQVHLNIQIHKPATCPICNKVFSKKGHLDRHIKIIHHNIKDYSDPCPHCGKVFTTRASLEPHIAMVHQGVRKKCDICNKVLSDLNKHMRTVHHTYRRKAKIPKDMLPDLDNPGKVFEPKIYGTKKQKTEFKPVTLKHSLPVSSSYPTLNIPDDQPTSPQDITESIKQELGLSSVITLEKITNSKSSSSKAVLPKLTYHGPRMPTTQTFGSISLTPISSLRKGEARLSPVLRPSPVVKISSIVPAGLPALLPIKKEI